MIIDNIMKTTTVYRVNEWSNETGMGNMVCLCADKQTIINYLTKDGYRHGILTDEFDRFSGDSLIDYIDDQMVLKFTPDESELNNLLGLPQDEPEYYIIHTLNLHSGSFFSK